MKIAEYNTLCEIAQEIALDDIESLEGFMYDCRQLGAKKVVKYIKNCLSIEADPKRDMILIFLSEDSSGV